MCRPPAITQFHAKCAAPAAYRLRVTSRIPPRKKPATITARMDSESAPGLAMCKQAEYNARDDERHPPSRRPSQQSKDVAANEQLLEKRGRQEQDRRATRLTPPAPGRGGVDAQHVYREEERARGADRHSSQHGPLDHHSMEKPPRGRGPPYSTAACRPFSA